MEKRGVILDSGGVLLRPIDGRWFPPPAFEQVLMQRGISYQEDFLESALGAGEEYLDAVHHQPLADEAAERPIWIRYYEIVLEALKVPGRSELAEAITAVWEVGAPVEPYPWTLPVLGELQRRAIPVVILSDAWPSLRRFFQVLELSGYVRAMVISGEEGITKPDRRVFAKARSLLGPDVSDVFFVDDWPDHVVAAAELGMRGLRLRHETARSNPAVEEITDLCELLDHVQAPGPTPSKELRSQRVGR